MKELCGSSRKAEFLLRSLVGYEKFDRRLFGRWDKAEQLQQQRQENGEIVRQGPKVCAHFEEAVLEKVLLTEVLEGETEKEKVVANIGFSYATYIQAAETVLREDPAWLQHPQVKKLKFSPKWVWGLLRRNKLRRRSATHVEKPEASQEQVREDQKKIQEAINELRLNPKQVHNGDETGVNWAVQLQKQYVPEDAERGSTPGGDTSGRYTAYLFSDSDGEMGPIFSVVKDPRPQLQNHALVIELVRFLFSDCLHCLEGVLQEFVRPHDFQGSQWVPW